MEGFAPRLLLALHHSTGWRRLSTSSNKGEHVALGPFHLTTRRPITRCYAFLECLKANVMGHCWLNSWSFYGLREILLYNPYRILTHWGRKDGRHFAEAIQCIFLNAKCCIVIQISLKYVRNGPLTNKPSLVQIMVWRRPGDKPLSEPMMA